MHKEDSGLTWALHEGEIAVISGAKTKVARMPTRFPGPKAAPQEAPKARVRRAAALLVRRKGRRAAALLVRRKGRRAAALL